MKNPLRKSFKEIIKKLYRKIFLSKEQYWKQVIIDTAPDYYAKHITNIQNSKFFKLATNVGYSYITDVATNEIVWLNDVLKDKVGDVVGEKCYKVLQNLDQPCSFCNNNKLSKEGVIDTWVHYNEHIDSLVLVTDTNYLHKNGTNRLYRFELSIPLSETLIININKLWEQRILRKQL